MGLIIDLQFCGMQHFISKIVLLTATLEEHLPEDEQRLMQMDLQQLGLLDTSHTAGR